MQPICYNEAFQEVLAACEPRTPVMVLHLNPAEGRPDRIDVRVVLNDSLTCDQLGEYFINPIHALHLLHRASMFALDYESCEQADFVQALYAVCNARYEREASAAPATPEPPLVTCSLTDVLDAIVQQHTTAPASGWEVVLGGARWLVVR